MRRQEMYLNFDMEAEIMKSSPMEVYNRRRRIILRWFVSK
jgi:hypothetical protein